MLDTLQQTQLQSAIVKAMYAATIESELDSQQAFEYIAARGTDIDSNPLSFVYSELRDVLQQAQISSSVV